LVSNVRKNGIPSQINLISLGKLEGVTEQELNLLAKGIEELYNHQSLLFSFSLPKHIEKLAHFYCQKLIQKKYVERDNLDSDNQEHPQIKEFVEIDINSISGKTAEQIGGEFLCNQALNELGLATFLKEKLKYTDSQINSNMLALIGRLLYSSSENQTARWLNDNSAVQEFYPLESGKVNKNQLYSAANQLYNDKQKIEKYLGQRIEKIFTLKRKIVLYDLTNTHFEGQMKNSKKAAFGKNKQKRSDCRQITLGMLTDENGFPVHTQYYQGNIGEPNTLEQVLKDLEAFGTHLFSGEKPCIIMDAGIATDNNVKLLLKKGYEYICVSRSGHKDLIDCVNEEELVKFKNKSDKELSAQLFKQKFEYEDQENKVCSIEESLVYIKSPDKEKKEHAMDQKKIQRFESGLKDIEKTINNPRGQSAIAKIHQRLGRLKEKNRGITGYFNIKIEDDTVKVTSIKWERKPDVPKEKKQGVYFLRTNISEKDEEKLWNLYRLVNEVEEAFGTLKSELNVRPNFHQGDATIESHINLCVLSYYVVNFIRYRLKSKEINLCWSEIRRIMSTQKRCLHVSRTKAEKALWTRYCTRPIPQAEEIYQAMGYKKIPYYRKNLIV
jgi:hypothetical protein